MKHINLLPPQTRANSPASADKLTYVFLGLLLLLTVTRAAWLDLANRAQVAEIRRLEADHARLEAVLGPLRASAIADGKRKERLAAIQSLLARKNGWSQTFRDFSEALPQGVSLNGLTSTREGGALRFLIKGQAPSNRKIAEFLQHLEGLPSASGANLHFSERERNVQPKQYRFEMSVPVAALGGKP